MKNRREEEIKCERKEKKTGKGKENEEGREEKRKRRKRRNDLLVFVFVNLFRERDSFSYGSHISCVDREGVEVVS